MALTERDRMRGKSRGIVRGTPGSSMATSLVRFGLRQALSMARASKGLGAGSTSTSASTGRSPLSPEQVRRNRRQRKVGEYAKDPAVSRMRLKAALRGYPKR